MRARMPVFGYFLIALFQWVLFAGTCRAETIIDRGGSIEGFGKLTWGISEEQAGNAYPDLHFGGYEIENSKEEPVKMYSRNTVPEKFDGVLFDSYDYGFKGNRFYKVRASLQSKIGPRTLVTRAEMSWNQLAEYLVRKYGAPKEHSTKYVTEYLVVVKEMRWEIGGVFIHLNYKGPERADEDQLIFEMGKRPEGRS
ncbi:MAG: hypothetical protein ACYC24_07425 [Desulfobacteria bacterium]